MDATFIIHGTQMGPRNPEGPKLAFQANLAIWRRRPELIAVYTTLVERESAQVHVACGMDEAKPFSHGLGLETIQATFLDR
jgi:hypothetical protein